MDAVQWCWRAVKAGIAAVAAAFAGLNLMIQVLIYAILLDIATGLIKAWGERSIASDISRKGVARKTLMLLAALGGEIAWRMVGLSATAPWGGEISAGAAVAAYYSIHEAVSIAENLAAAGVPLPQFLVDRLKQLKGPEKSP